MKKSRGIGSELLAEMLELKAPWKVVGYELNASTMVMRVEIQWPQEVAPKCPRCQKAGRVHDHRELREWRHLDAMAYRTMLCCSIPRVKCAEHGVLTMDVPWAEPNNRVTMRMEAHCIQVLKTAQSVSAAARQLGLSHAEVHRIQGRAVERGLGRRDMSGVAAVGMDEKNFGRGHSYATVLSDHGQRVVLEVVQDRTQEAALQALDVLPAATKEQVAAATIDMWEPYQKALLEKLPNAEIVHDRFHIAKHLGEAVDKVRRREHKELSEQGIGVLSGKRYVFLRNPNDWSEQEADDFDLVSRMDLKVARAWALKETFGRLYEYTSETWARKFFERWFVRATRSRLLPMRKVAWMLRRHLDHIVTWTRHRLTNALCEGLNSKIQAIKSAARGFRLFAHYRIAILFHCGGLPLEP